MIIIIITVVVVVVVVVVSSNSLNGSFFLFVSPSLPPLLDWTGFEGSEDEGVILTSGDGHQL